MKCRAPFRTAPILLPSGIRLERRSLNADVSPAGLGRWLRDPLLFFLIASLLVFLLYLWLAPETEQGLSLARDASTIVVDRAQLEEFVSYRSRLFDEQRVSQRLNAMSEMQRRDLIDDYVREEALYRAAIDFGLDVDDYVIRRRLVQKMDFMAEGVGEANDEPSTQALAGYYTENADRYMQPANATFTHVFFSSAARSAIQAEQLAIDARDELIARQAGFADGISVGERFVYQNNYVERTKEEVEDHFGAGFAAQIFAVSAVQDAWFGPLESSAGYHVVFLAQRQRASQIEFDSIAPRVRRDFLADRAQSRRSEFADAIISRFDVQISPELSVVGEN